jgi:Icc-related predicted phosphoesterase
MKKYLSQFLTWLLSLVIGVDSANKKLQETEDEHAHLINLNLRLRKEIEVKGSRPQEQCLHGGHSWRVLDVEPIDSVPIGERTFCSICGVQQKSWNQLKYATDAQIEKLLAGMKKRADKSKKHENYLKYGPHKNANKKSTT